VTKIDWIALGLVALAGLCGWRRGLIGTALALVGLIGGAVIGSRVAPTFLSGGTASHYSSLVGLGGALGGAVLCNVAASIAARLIRGGIRLVPPLRLLDALGGLAVGALFGLALVWVAGAVVLQIPGHASWKRQVHASHVLTRLNRVVPPHDVLRLPKDVGTIVTQFAVR